MIERPDPDALLAGPLGQWLASQQGARDTAKAQVQMRRKLAWIGAAVVGSLTLLLSEFDFEAMFWFGGFTLMAGFFWGEMAKTKVVKAVKLGINQAIAQALGIEYAAEPTKGEEWRRACAFGLVAKHDRSDFEDCWSGHLGELPFRLYEAHCEKERDSDDNKWETVFRGAVIAVGFTRRFHGTTLVERNGARKRWFGGEKEEITLDGVLLQRCDMVDPAFEARFTVWGNDGVEARYLVHPEYIERLTAVEKAFSGNNIRCLFCGGELLILLETSDQFESGSIEASKDRELLLQTIDQFTTLADLAKRLNEAPRGNYQPAASI